MTFSRDCLFALETWINGYQLEVRERPNNKEELVLYYRTPLNNEEYAYIPVTSKFDDILTLLGVEEKDILTLKKPGLDARRFGDRHMMFTILSNSPFFDLKYVRWSGRHIIPKYSVCRAYENFLDSKYQAIAKSISSKGTQPVNEEHLKSLKDNLFARYPHIELIMDMIKEQGDLLQRVKDIADAENISSLMTPIRKMKALLTHIE